MNELVKLKNDIEERKRITEWLDTYERSSGNLEYAINPDLTVDVHETLDISHLGLTEIPFQFGIARWWFYCKDNNLTSLKGCPRFVGGDIWCQRNKLTTLEHAPKKPVRFEGNPCTPIYRKLKWEEAHVQCRKVWI